MSAPYGSAGPAGQCRSHTCKWNSFIFLKRRMKSSPYPLLCIILNRDCSSCACLGVGETVRATFSLHVCIHYGEL